MLRLTIETPRPFQFRTTLLSHGWIELAPFRHDEDYLVLSRTERLDDGRIVDLEFAASSEENLSVTIGGIDGDLSSGQEAAIRQAARRIFNLDLELAPFYELLDGRPRYEWVCRYGGGRLLRAPTVWEDLAKTLLTTNTTWKMTRSMVDRLTEMGPSCRTGSAFPTPGDIAAAGPEVVAKQVRAGYRNEYLFELATRIASGEVDVEAWARTDMDSEKLFGEIRSLKGFGPYAAGACLKLLGRYDYLALDSAARSCYAGAFNQGNRAPDKHIERHYEPYGTWKGLVIWMDVMREFFLQNKDQ